MEEWWARAQAGLNFLSFVFSFCFSLLADWGGGKGGEAPLWRQGNLGC